MSRRINQRRYSEAFKKMILEEYRQGKWASPYEIAKVYGISQVTVIAWIDATGLKHLRNRRVIIQTLGEVSELQRLRAENKRIRTILVDEMVKKHDTMSMLKSAVSRLGMTIPEFQHEFARTGCKEDARSGKINGSVQDCSKMEVVQ